MKHKLLGFSFKKLKITSIKTPFPLPYINVVGQKFIRSIVSVKPLQKVVVSIYFVSGCSMEW